MGRNRTINLNSLTPSSNHQAKFISLYIMIWFSFVLAFRSFNLHSNIHNLWRYIIIFLYWRSCRGSNCTNSRYLNELLIISYRTIWICWGTLQLLNMIPFCMTSKIIYSDLYKFALVVFLQWNYSIATVHLKLAILFLCRL